MTTEQNGEARPLLENEMDSKKSAKTPSRQDCQHSKPDSLPTGETTPSVTLEMQIDDSQSQIDITSDHEQEKLISNMGGIMNLLKTMLGTGVLGLPAAVRNAGLLVGTVGIAVVGVIATHCMHTLVRSAYILCKRLGRRHLTFAEVAEASVSTGPESVRRFSKCFRHLVDGFLVSTQMGICSVYIGFVSQNLQQVVDALVPGGTGLSDRVFSTLVFACLLPCVLFRSLRLLTLASTIANIFIAIGFVVLFTYYIIPDLPDVSERPLVANWDRLPAFFGSAIFALEGISMVMPVYNKMRTPEDYPGCAGVLGVSTVITICIYVAVAFYGYLKYGEGAKGSITLNLPSDNWLGLTVKGMFAISMFLSYSVQFYVPVNILWPPLSARLRSELRNDKGEYVFKAVLITCTYLVSMLVPHLEILISLVGAMAMSFLSITFPALIEVFTLLGVKHGEHVPRDACVSCLSPSVCCSRSQPKSYRLVFVKDVALITIGILGGVVGTYVGIVDVVNSFSSKE